MNGTLTDQQLIIHAFAPADGPDAEGAYAQLREIWSRCRVLMGIDKPVARLPETLPPDLTAATTQPAVAALEDSAALRQMIVRRVRDVVNFSMVFTGAEETASRRRRIGSASPPGWVEFDRWWDELSAGSTTALFGLVRLYMAAINEGPASPLDAAAAVRVALPPADKTPFWWDRGRIHLNEFAMWEVSPDHDARPERRIAIVSRADRDPQLSVWTWSNGDPAIPPLARYLMHAAKIRYEARVWGDGQAVDRLRQRIHDGASLLRAALSESTDRSVQVNAVQRLHVEKANLATTIQDVREMRRTVEIAKANMGSALAEPLRSDLSLAEWLAQILEDTAEYLDAARDVATELVQIAQEIRLESPDREGQSNSRGRDDQNGSDGPTRSPEGSVHHRPSLSGTASPDDDSSTVRRSSLNTRHGRAQHPARIGFGVGIVDYSARPVHARDDAQDRLAALVREVLDDLGVRLDETEHEGTGDGLIVFLPSDVDVHRALPWLVQSWRERLASHNEGYRDRLRLRLAFCTAPVGVAAAGYANPSAIEVSNLRNSTVLRRAMADDQQLAEVAVLVSDQLYDLVSRYAPSPALARFRHVHTTEGTAWLWVAAPARPPTVTSADPESRERPRRPQRNPTHHRVLALADEWLPARGGLSAFNRYLCSALAAAGAEVHCLIPDVSGPALADASKAGVQLVAAPGMLGRPPLMLRPALPGDVAPDVVVGHGRVTGPMARSVADQFYPTAVRLHLVHMDPNQIEWYRLDREQDAAHTAEERSRLELSLGRGRNARLVAVGPVLHEWLERDLFVHGVAPIRLDPGFDGLEPGPGEPPPGKPLILVMGRVDDPLKGVDIAARAIGHAIRELSPHATQWDLLLRGSPEGQARKIRDSVRGLIDHSSVNVNAHNYATDFARVEQDLRRASVLLMPSRVEGFGLVGLEAIAAGTPALVSDRSGLGVLLTKELPSDLANQVVVSVTDDVERNTRIWGHRLAAMLENRPAAFATARKVRKLMVREWTWSRAVEHLLAALGPGDHRVPY